MSIQSTFNQGLSVAAMLYSQTAGAEKTRQKVITKEVINRDALLHQQAQERADVERLSEKRKAEAHYQALSRDALESTVPAGTTDAERDVELKAYEDWAKAAHERYLRDPKSSTYQDWRDVESGYVEAKDWEMDRRATAMRKDEQARQEALAAREAEQRRLSESNRIRKQILEIGGIH